MLHGHVRLLCQRLSADDLYDLILGVVVLDGPALLLALGDDAMILQLEVVLAELFDSVVGGLV